MKKVCILSTVEYSRMTLLSLYTDILKEKNIEYDVICVKKKALNIDNNASKIYEFDAQKTANKSVIKKVLHFWSMRKLVKKVFNENEYGFVVVWNQVTAFMFADILRKRFDKRYCINIRDYQYDNFPIIKGRLKRSLEHSAFNTVSSDDFRKFLPRGEYLMIHSFNESLLNSLKRCENYRKDNEPIRILNIGQIRWYENIYPLIDELKNDKRFELYFVGTGSEEIEKYIDGKDIKNVFVKGRFQPSETTEFLKNADMIFNLYGTGNMHVDTALSIKLYYAIHLGIPILTYEGTYMNDVSKKVGIGFTVKSGDFSDIGNRIYDYYHTLDVKKVRENCDAYIEEAKKSHKKLKKVFEEFLI